MRPNPVLKKLGFSESDRLVILHADDIGMCQASVSAFADLWEAGRISSAALMMPCPWARNAAEYCRTHLGVDLGVHATLTSEWDTYRWGPLSTRDPSSGLMDREGFFWRSSQEAQEHGDPEAVVLELQLQVQRAMEWGVSVTHVDTHMGTVAHPKFIPAYLQAAIQAHVPFMLPRADQNSYLELGMDAETAAGLSAFTAELEDQGLPLVDRLISMPLDQPEGQLEIAQQLLGNLAPGITHFLFHPALDTPELRSICPDWPSRVANYQVFMSQEVQGFLAQAGIQVIGYRALMEVLP
jgi:hypothetical protein